MITIIKCILSYLILYKSVGQEFEYYKYTHIGCSEGMSERQPRRYS